MEGAQGWPMLAPTSATDAPSATETETAQPAPMAVDGMSDQENKDSNIEAAGEGSVAGSCKEEGNGQRRGSTAAVRAVTGSTSSTNPCAPPASFLERIRSELKIYTKEVRCDAQ